MLLLNIISGELVNRRVYGLKSLRSLVNSESGLVWSYRYIIATSSINGEILSDDVRDHETLNLLDHQILVESVEKRINYEICNRSTVSLDSSQS
jgi:hypothetical protein